MVCRALASALLVTAVSSRPLLAQQTSYTWEQLKQRFLAGNPTLQAGRLNIQESRANEITAYLRPNPDFSIAADQFNFHPLQPLALADQIAEISYLHERGHKRELRRDVAQKATAVAMSQQTDLERTLMFNLRSAFVQLLQAKAVLENAKENLDYYDHELEINRARQRAGDIADVDEYRLELQRIQFESDVQTSTVNVRTAKIQLLTLMNDRASRTVRCHRRFRFYGAGPVTGRASKNCAGFPSGLASRDASG
jgi:cobalt-zinc-cadmium efflux system outer membrane protein